jgi:hypothetical protein
MKVSNTARYSLKHCQRHRWITSLVPADLAAQQNRPNLNPVDYQISNVLEEYGYRTHISDGDQLRLVGWSG